MRRISSLIAPNAVVVVVVVSATAISAVIGQARAEDCLAAPNAAAPPGQHWYYRVDRATQRHCWYLHAMLRIAHQAHHASVLTNEKIEHPAPAAPVPVATAPWPAAVAPMPAVAAPMPAADPPVPAPAPAADNAPNLPHVTVLAVKTIAVRPPGARTQPRSGHDADGASISQASARAFSAAPQSKSGSTLFFVLVFGLGIATFLMAIFIKCVAPRASWRLRPVRSGADMMWQQARRR